MSIILPLAFASLPGWYAWWSGRRLIPHLNDGALGELLLARANRVGQVLVVSWVAILVVAWGHAAWAILLSLLAMLAGGFPARRRIFDEDWHLLAYLEHHVRVVLGAFGAWIPVLFAPVILDAAGRWSGMFAWGLVLLVTLWSVFGSRVLLTLVRARPLEDPDLALRFRDVLARARCRAPVVYRAGARGGCWVNGFALPTPWAPAVLLTDGLLEALDPDEITAIFAHEVSHLEQFTPGRWLRRIAVPPLLAAVFAIIYLQLDAMTTFGQFLVVAWPAAVIFAVAALLTRSRRDETESDLRAVELTGDPDAMIRGLTTIHQLNRLPRRLDAQLQKRLTHPSLARRIQAIRMAVGSESSDGDAHLAVRAQRDDEAVVVLEPDRIQWLDGVPPSVALESSGLWQEARHARAVKYGELRELRVAAPRADRRELIAVDLEGNKTTVRLRPDDANRVQRFLDQVDVHLRTERDTGSILPSGFVRLAAVIGVLLGMLPPAKLPLLIFGVAAVIWPKPAMVVAAGAIATLVGVVGAAWGLVSYAAPVEIVSGLSLHLVAGIILLAIAVVERSRSDRRPRTTAVVTGLALAAGMIGVILYGTSLEPDLAGTQLHQWVRSLPAPLLLLTGAAAMLVAHPRPTRRAGGLVVAAVVVVVLLAGTEGFRARMVADALHRRPEAVIPTAVEPEWRRSMDVVGGVQHLSLSRSGKRVAASVWREGTGSYRESDMEFVVEMADSVRVVRGSAMAWDGDDALMVLAAGDHGLNLTRLDLITGTERHVRLPYLVDPQLSVGHGGWMVTAYPASGNGFEQITRGTGSEPTTRHLLAAIDAEDLTMTEVLPRSSGHALVVGTGVSTGLVPLPFVGWAPMAMSTELWSVEVGRADRMGRTAFPLSCLSMTGGSSIVCVHAGASGTELWGLEPDTEHLEPLATVPGWSWPQSHGGGVILSGATSDLTIVDVHPVRVRVIADSLVAGTASGRDVGGWRQAVSYRDGNLAVAVGDGSRTRIDVYRVPPGAPRSPSP